jgi:hypothetical protein
MLACSSVFHRTWLDFSRTIGFPVGSEPRIFCVCLSAKKLARIKPCANRSDSQFGIFQVGLAAGHILHTCGIRQLQFKVAVGRDRPHRIPVDASRYHRVHVFSVSHSYNAIRPVVVV